MLEVLHVIRATVYDHPAPDDDGSGGSWVTEPVEPVPSPLCFLRLLRGKCYLRFVLPKDSHFEAFVLIAVLPMIVSDFER